MRRKRLYFYCDKSIGEWVAEYKDGVVTATSLKMHDALLFDSVSRLSREYKEEWVEIKLFSPPKPRIQRKRPSSKKSKKKVKVDAAVLVV